MTWPYRAREKISVMLMLRPSELTTELDARPGQPDQRPGHPAIEIAIYPRHHRARRAQPPGTRHCPWCGTMRRSLRLQPDTVARASEQVAGTRLPRGSAGRVDVR